MLLFLGLFNNYHGNKIHFTYIHYLIINIEFSSTDSDGEREDSDTTSHNSVTHRDREGTVLYTSCRFFATLFLEKCIKFKICAIDLSWRCAVECNRNSQGYAFDTFLFLHDSTFHEDFQTLFFSKVLTYLSKVYCC